LCKTAPRKHAQRGPIPRTFRPRSGPVRTPQSRQNEVRHQPRLQSAAKLRDQLREEKRCNCGSDCGSDCGSFVGSPVPEISRSHRIKSGRLSDVAWIKMRNPNGRAAEASQAEKREECGPVRTEAIGSRVGARPVVVSERKTEPCRSWLPPVGRAPLLKCRPAGPGDWRCWGTWGPGSGASPQPERPRRHYGHVCGPPTERSEGEGSKRSGEHYCP